MSDDKTKDDSRIIKANTNTYIKLPKLNLAVMKQAELASRIPNITINPSLAEKWVTTMDRLKEIIVPIQEAIKAISSSPIWPGLLKIGGYLVEVAEAVEEEKYNQFKFKQAILALWNNLEEELKTQNRYFPKSEFITIFEKCAKEAKYMLRKGSVLYRARKIEMKKVPHEVFDIINAAMENYSNYDYQRSLEKAKNIWEYIESINQDEWEQAYLNRFPLENNDFWGYDAKDSDAPPENAVQGRVNPIGISYLYTARDVNTAVSEIQPTIEQAVSVAKIKTLTRMNIFNFDFYDAFKNAEIFEQPLGEFQEQLGISFWELEIFFDTLSELFSKPAIGNAENYYATQYISELIKHLGFDGIKYKSSLKKGGFNIVLFDISKDSEGNPINYRIIGSSLHRVENVKVTTRNILPRKIQKVRQNGQENTNE